MSWLYPVFHLSVTGWVVIAYQIGFDGKPSLFRRLSHCTDVRFPIPVKAWLLVVIVKPLTQI